MCRFKCVKMRLHKDEVCGEVSSQDARHLISRVNRIKQNSFKQVSQSFCCGSVPGFGFLLLALQESPFFFLSMYNNRVCVYGQPLSFSYAP
jgi:hypothetical protein